MDKKAKAQVAKRLLTLYEQSNAILKAADGQAGLDTHLLQAASETIEALAKGQAKKLTQGSILELPSNASDTELRSARQRRAVRRGESLYLPSWRDMAVAFPNVLLRSALFSARHPGESFFDEPIATQGDAVMTMTGYRLCHYDRKVFAVCLKYYREERELHSEKADLGWVKVSYWQLAQDLKLPYGLNSHIAIRESLIRLNAVHLRIRVGRQDIPMPRLIEVAFDDEYKARESAAERIKSSDLVAFRVLDSMANLFGPQEWTAVSESAIFDYSGLKGWVTSFYSTHKGPYALKVSELLKLSGSDCELKEFRRRLKDALTMLKGDEVDSAIRVENFEMDKVHLTVSLTRWSAQAGA